MWRQNTPLEEKETNRKQILKYLGHRGAEDERLSALIDRRRRTVEEKSAFRAVGRIFPVSGNPPKIEGTEITLCSLDAGFYLAGCDRCRVTAYTLGFEVDRLIKYHRLLDMTFATVLDRTASRILEEKRNRWDENNLPSPRTFRFAPGYGDLPIDLLCPLAGAIDAGRQAGISVNPAGLMSPSKSILGIAGLGANRAGSCARCIRKKTCLLRKEGERCYPTD